MRSVGDQLGVRPVKDRGQAAMVSGKNLDCDAGWTPMNGQKQRGLARKKLRLNSLQIKSRSQSKDDPADESNSE